jgi:tRNA(Ile2) C34 agmatinyltransferase TiaS
MSNSIRKCHDCGKETTNYRCNECWETIRKEQGLSKSSASEKGFGVRLSFPTRIANREGRN